MSGVSLQMFLTVTFGQPVPELRRTGDQQRVVKRVSGDEKIGWLNASKDTPQCTTLFSGLHALACDMHFSELYANLKHAEKSSRPQYKMMHTAIFGFARFSVRHAFF